MIVQRVRGAVLLEALAALVVVSVVGSALLLQVSAHVDAYRQVRDRELEMVRAAEILAETRLLDRDALVLRLGRRNRGDFRVAVSRPLRDLFRVGVASVEAPQIELLATAFYRPQRSDP